MRQVAHLVGDHGKAASRLAGPRRLDGGVQREQVGLLGNALDHLENLADVHGLGIECLDLPAGRADLRRQLAHGGDVLLHHLTTVLGLMPRAAGLLRGIRRVAGDLLGGGAKFVDRSRHAVGATGLLVGVGHRCVRSAEHALCHFVDLQRGRGHLADRFMDTLDEAIEGGRQLTELISGLHGEAPGQVTLALGNVGHGAAHVGERTHQHTNQHAQQQQDERHGGNRGDQRSGAETGQRGIGLVTIQRNTHVPLHRRQALDWAEAEDARITLKLRLDIATTERRRILRVNILERLHDHLLIGMDQHLAVAADKKGVPHAIKIQRVEHIHQSFQA